MTSPDYRYRVEITADVALNDAGLETFHDAICDVDIMECMREAIRTALDARLPQTAWDTSRNEERAIEWYCLRVVESPTAP